jgi:hypothetical protein
MRVDDQNAGHIPFQFIRRAEMRFSKALLQRCERAKCKNDKNDKQRRETRAQNRQR